MARAWRIAIILITAVSLTRGIIQKFKIFLKKERIPPKNRYRTGIGQLWDKNTLDLFKKTITFIVTPFTRIAYNFKKHESFII